MANLHIVREHTLGHEAARKVTRTWAEQVQRDFGMQCTAQQGDMEDVVHFTRSGVNGTLTVSRDRFVLDAKLGFLLGAFKDRIEGEIVKNLDALLAPPAKTAAKKAAPKK